MIVISSIFALARQAADSASLGRGSEAGAGGGLLNRITPNLMGVVFVRCGRDRLQAD